MKNKIHIYLFLLSFVSSLISCTDTDVKEMYKNDNDYPNSNNSLGKAPGRCNCASFYTLSGCYDDCIVKTFMKDKNEIYYDITWETCDNNEING